MRNDIDYYSNPVRAKMRNIYVTQMWYCRCMRIALQIWEGKPPWGRRNFVGDVKDNTTYFMNKRKD